MPDARHGGILLAGAVYRSDTFKECLRLGEAGWRQMKKDGLRVHKIGKTVVVTTDDFLEYLQTRK